MISTKKSGYLKVYANLIKYSEIPWIILKYFKSYVQNFQAALKICFIMLYNIKSYKN